MKPSTICPSRKATTARNRLDAEFLRDIGILVDIHLGEADFSARRLDDFSEHRAQLLAGAAPGGPEIDENQPAQDSSITSARKPCKVTSITVGGGAAANGQGSKGVFRLSALRVLS